MSLSWLKKLGLLAGGLAAWYAFTGPSTQQLESKKEYPLPDEIKVVSTTLPFETREVHFVEADTEGNLEDRIESEEVIKTENIDFSQEFVIETERYRVVKKEEWLPSRLIGHTVSMLARLYFWDWDAGWGLDESRTRAVLSLLENNKNIKGLTIRVNHNEVWYDCYRLFGDDKVAERNHWLARLLMGVPTSIFGELLAELSRSDYYNPMNQTVVLYSNIESVSAHEIGHHMDYQRFTYDWGYGLAGSFPPVKLYKEWQASQNAKDILTPEDDWQFYRYLLPAFLTYLIWGYSASRKVLQKNVLRAEGSTRRLKDLDEDEKPEIHPLQTLRHLGTLNLDLYAGLAAYNACVENGSPEMLGYLAFAAGLIASDVLTDTILKRIIPYRHGSGSSIISLVKQVFEKNTNP